MDTVENRLFADAWRPNPVEGDYDIVEIDGEIPRELNGTLYRNGPCQKTLPKAGPEALHTFDGDALVHAIRFDDGAAHYLSRFAQTESFVREQAEGAYCYAGLNVPADIEIEDPPPAIQPNTNIVPHAGKLFALVENAPPFEMDPITLESKGLWNYDGKMLGMATTAHPKIDVRTGQMWIHGYQPLEPYLQLYVVERDGQVSQAEAVDAPWPSMLHDFAITENFVIFPLSNLYFDLEPMLSGKRFSDAVRERRDLSMKFGVRRREPGSPTVWIDGPERGFMFHPGNAYEDDGRIFMDACTYEDPQALMDSLDTARQGYSVDGFTAHPYQYEIDPAAETCKHTKLSDASAEFPRLDDRLVGYRNRWGYAATAEAGSAGAEGLFRRITKYDRQNGTSINRPTVLGQWVGEPVFVPRQPEAAEDDGFVLNVLYDAANQRTAVDVLDARAIDADPLARLWLKERLPLGFHGNFKSAAS